MKKPCSRLYCQAFWGGGWIRTTEVTVTDLTVCPFGPLGNSLVLYSVWSWWTDLNPDL